MTSMVKDVGYEVVQDDSPRISFDPHKMPALTLREVVEIAKKNFPNRELLVVPWIPAVPMGCVISLALFDKALVDERLLTEDISKYQTLRELVIIAKSAGLSFASTLLQQDHLDETRFMLYDLFKVKYANQSLL